MIDTLGFKLYGIKDKYKLFYQMWQDNLSGKSVLGIMRENGDEVPDYSTDRRIEKLMIDWSNKTIIPYRYYDKLKLASSNHEIAFTIHPPTDTLEVQVSIPKYLYGTNVLELVVPPFHKDFTINARSPYAHLRYAMKVLRKIIPRIINEISRNNYLGHDLDFWDIEISRLDICVNQVFKDREEATRYIQYMKRVLKKHERIHKSNRTQWANSFAYQTDRYYAKIYHKGDEFRDVQMKDIKKMNKERVKLGKQVEGSNIHRAGDKIDALQQYADRIVRYEFEFKPAYMSYLFNNRINKAHLKTWEIMKKLFKKMGNKPEDLAFLKQYEKRYVDITLCEHTKPIAEEYLKEIKLYQMIYNERKGTWKPVEFTTDQYQIYFFLAKNGFRTPASIKDWIRYMTKELSQTRKFFLRKPGPNSYTGDILSAYGVPTKIPFQHPTPQDHEFRMPLFKLMVDELKKFFNNFQLQNKLPEDDLLDKIDNYNLHKDQLAAVQPSEFERKRILKEKIGQRYRTYILAFHRSTAQSMEVVIKRNIMSRTTYFKCKKSYEKLTGSSANVGSAYFGDVNRNFDEMYIHLMNELQYGQFSRFYEEAEKKLSQIMDIPGEEDISIAS